MQEPRYFDSPDALNLCDLTPPQATRSIDGLRLWLQRFLPLGLLDKAGRERREIDEVAEALADSAKPLGADEDLEASAPRSVKDSTLRSTRWLVKVFMNLKKDSRESGEAYSRKGKEREGPSEMKRRILDIIGPNGKDSAASIRWMITNSTFQKPKKSSSPITTGLTLSLP